MSDKPQPPEDRQAPLSEQEAWNAALDRPTDQAGFRAVIPTAGGPPRSVSPGGGPPGNLPETRPQTRPRPSPQQFVPAVRQPSRPRVDVRRPTDPSGRAPGAGPAPAGEVAGRVASANTPHAREGLRMTPNWLVGVGGDVDRKTYHIGGRMVTIGRSVSNYVQTVDSKASRTHCQLRPLDGGLVIVDMNSGNGTHVNGQAIREHTLTHGDIVEVGDVKFVFHEMAAYAVNHGIQRKDAGRRVHQETSVQAAEGFQGMLQAALQAADGNVERAARNFGMDVRWFKQMLKHHGVTRD